MYKTKMILALAQAIRGSLEDSWMARRQLVAIKRIVMKKDIRSTRYLFQSRDGKSRSYWWKSTAISGLHLAFQVIEICVVADLSSR
jgi:hypothetical protein